MKIGELATRTGLSRDTIRFYERQGLIRSEPGQSETNNYRDYPDHLVAHLGFLAEAREAGLSVAELRELQEATQGSCAPEDAINVLQQRVADLRRTIETSEQLITFFEASITRLQGKGCPNTSG